MGDVEDEFQDLFCQEHLVSSHFLDTQNFKTWIFPTNFKQRDYQFNIIKNSLFSNTLVCLPTGLGKTFIAAVIMYNYYRWFPNSIIVFMAPTRPLVNQQIDACFKITGIPHDHSVELTGHSSVELRKKMWETKRVFFMTPETFRNDLQTSICPAERVVLTVFDEAHRSTGNYAYVEVIKELNIQQSRYRVLALSATPGSDLQKVQTVINHLNIEKIESRTEDSFDVAPFIHSKSIREVVVEQSELMQSIFNRFGAYLGNILKKLVQFKAYKIESPEKASPYGLIASRDYWRKSKGSLPQQTGNMIEGYFALAITLCGFVQHLFNEGIFSFYSSVNDFIVEAKQKGNISKLKKEFIQDRALIHLLKDVQEEMAKPTFVSHPKIEKLIQIVLEHFANHKENIINETRNGNTVDVETRIMIFSTFRTSVEEICNVLKEHQPLVKPAIFIGQSAGKKGKGLKQKEQLQIINDFKNGIFNVLVATSIGEEGLDIGEIDLIICFDNKKSPIKMLQRIGRTGRKRKGEICLLLNKGQEENDVKLARTKYKNVQKGMFDSTKLNMYSGETCSLFPKKFDRPDCEKVEIVIPEPAAKPTPKKKQVKLSEHDIEFYTNNFMKFEYEMPNMSKFTQWQSSYLPIKVIPRSEKCNKFVELMQKLEEYKLEEPYIEKKIPDVVSRSVPKKTPKKEIQEFQKVEISLFSSSPLYSSQPIFPGKRNADELSDIEQTTPKKHVAADILVNNDTNSFSNNLSDIDMDDFFTAEKSELQHNHSFSDANDNIVAEDFTTKVDHLPNLPEHVNNVNEDVIIPQTPEKPELPVESQESYMDDDFDWNAVELPMDQIVETPVISDHPNVNRENSIISVNDSQDEFYEELEGIDWDSIDQIANNLVIQQERVGSDTVLPNNSIKRPTPLKSLTKLQEVKTLTSSPEFNPQKTPMRVGANIKKRNVVLSSSPCTVNSPYPAAKRSNLVRNTPLQERLQRRKLPRKPPKVRGTPKLDCKKAQYPIKKKAKKNLLAKEYFEEEAIMSDNDPAEVSSDELEDDLDTNLSDFIASDIEYESRVNSPEDFHKIYRGRRPSTESSTQMIYGDLTKKGQLYQIIHPTKRAEYAGSSEVDSDEGSMADFVVDDDFVEYEQTQGRFFDCTMQIPEEPKSPLDDETFDTKNLLDGVDLNDLIEFD
ncbi:3'-5' DNA helicase [Boothiomyces sp. JEL0866]|nr:3'-5' DNA helicase [Boothiomyces sp. JEL0866]